MGTELVVLQCVLGILDLHDYWSRLWRAGWSALPGGGRKWSALPGGGPDELEWSTLPGGGRDELEWSVLPGGGRDELEWSALPVCG